MQQIVIFVLLVCNHSSVQSLLIVVLIWLVFWVRSQDQEILNNWRLRQVLICGELSSLTLADQDGCVMSLEASDSLRFACLANGVHGVTHAHLRLNWLELLVQRDKHARVNRQSQVE